MKMNNLKFKNPVADGWYADPEARIYGGKLFIYATRSQEYNLQLNLDLFVSELPADSGMLKFENYASIIDMSTFEGIYQAVWAPTVIEKDNLYYMVFAANDIKKSGETGGLYIAVSGSPYGPFKNLLNKPLINEFINGAQPIDAHLFKDSDGKIYLYYGGWGHLNVALMHNNMRGFELLKELTPSTYVEAPCMIKENGIYYLMWSSGSWTDGTYSVHYSASNSPLTVNEKGIILSKQEIADGPGHNGVFKFNNNYYIAYHRRIPGDKNPHHRILCVDSLQINGENIETVKMT